MASIPYVHILHSIQCDDGGDFEELVEYGEIYYHLLLRYNQNEPNFIKNVALQKLYDAMNQEDEDAIDDANDECTDIT